MNKITIQDGKATHVVAYVSWEKEEIISEAEYKAKLEEQTNIYAADHYVFGQWLNAHYNANEIWDMNETEKEEVKADWLRSCRDDAEYELSYDRRVLV